MKLRKIFAGVVAAAMATTMATSAFAASNGDRLQPAEATLAFADAGWTISNWGKSDDAETTVAALKNANITGNGEYTVSVDISGGVPGFGSDGEPILDQETGDPISYTTMSGIGAMAVMVNVPADDEAYNNLIIDITSVKFDDVETMIDGVASYTNAEDGIYRSTVINQWASKKDTDRSTNFEAASNVITEFADVWSKCEVTFTIIGWPEAGSEPEAPADPEPEAPADPEPEAPANPGDSSKPNAGTGAEGLALVAGVAVLAAGAVVVAKKRK